MVAAKILLSGTKISVEGTMVLFFIYRIPSVIDHVLLRVNEILSAVPRALKVNSEILSVINRTLGLIAESWFSKINVPLIIFKDMPNAPRTVFLFMYKFIELIINKLRMIERFFMPFDAINHRDSMFIKYIGTGQWK